MREVVVAYQRLEIAMEMLVHLAGGIPLHHVREVFLIATSLSRAVLAVRLVEGATEEERTWLRILLHGGEVLHGDFERLVEHARRHGKDYSALLLWAAEPARMGVQS